MMIGNPRRLVVMARSVHQLAQNFRVGQLAFEIELSFVGRK